MLRALLFCLCFCCVISFAGAQENPYKTPEIGAFYSGLTDLKNLSSGKAIKLPSNQGAIVAGVVPGSPAAEAGLTRFTIITRVGGEDVIVPSDIKKILLAYPPKKKLVVSAFVPQFTKGNASRMRWKRKTFRLSPVTYVDIFKKSIEGQESEVSGNAIYTPKGSEQVVNDHTGIVARVVDSGTQVTLQATIKYVGEDWLFVKNLIVKSGGLSVTIENLAMERDNTSTVWEWQTLDAKGGSKILKALVLLQSETSADLTYVGNQYSKTVELDEDDHDGIRLMLDYYDYRKNWR